LADDYKVLKNKLFRVMAEETKKDEKIKDKEK